jgi:dipeptidyl aminopeptidase/acylaminoacyl peptidase
MKTKLALLLSLLAAFPLLAVDVADTRLLTDPAISANRIAFAYANDLWTANVDGSNVSRLTSHMGVESAPRFSPDGSLVAFTGRYEGSADAPLTEPGVDVVEGEYLLAVDGKELKAPDNLYARFERTSGRFTNLTTSSSRPLPCSTSWSSSWPWSRTRSSPAR